jgi:hypothetical protein
MELLDTTNRFTMVEVEALPAPEDLLPLLPLTQVIRYSFSAGYPLTISLLTENLQILDLARLSRK